MSSYPSELYRNLMLISSNNSAFYFKDLLLDDVRYRVFNYRLCSYELFHENPFALNCRGTMFDVSAEDAPLLVSLPPEKFFNYEEGNGKIKHQSGQLHLQMEKLDGSLISTYLHRSTLRLKSKTSLSSSQATQAMELLQASLKDELDRLVRLGYTVNMEYTSPLNPIVLQYVQSKLTILSIRSHQTGDTLYAYRLDEFLRQNDFPSMRDHLVPFQLIADSLSHDDYLDKVHGEEEGEGYVLEIRHDDQRRYLVKVKTNKYSTLHQTLSNASSSKYLFHSILHELTDDLKSLLIHDRFASEKLRRMEEFVQPKYNQFIEMIEQFHQANGHLPRKDFAMTINADSTMKPYLHLLMNLYQGKDNRYDKFAFDNPKLVFRVSIEHFDSEEFLQGISSLQQS